MDKKAISEWKMAYGKIYRCRIDDDLIYFRAPTYNEYSTYRESVRVEGDERPPFSLPQAEEALVSSVVLNKQEEWVDSLSIPQMSAMISAIEKIADFRTSMFEPKYAKHREDKMEIEPLYPIIVLIVRAFPGITPDDVKNWNSEKLLRHLVMAEDILGWDLKTGPRTGKEAPEQEDSHVYERYNPQRVTTPAMSMEMAENHPPVPPADPMNSGSINVEAEAAEMHKFLSEP